MIMLPCWGVCVHYAARFGDLFLPVSLLSASCRRLHANKHLLRCVGDLNENGADSIGHLEVFNEVTVRVHLSLACWLAQGI